VEVTVKPALAPTIAASLTDLADGRPVDEVAIGPYGVRVLALAPA
jgi:hypothetical protein